MGILANIQITSKIQRVINQINFKKKEAQKH